MKIRTRLKRLLSLAICTALFIGVIPFHVANATTIIDMTHFDVPINDFTLDISDYQITLNESRYSFCTDFDDYIYTENGITWYNITDDRKMVQNLSTFEEGKEYKVYIVLEASEGYEFKAIDNYTTDMKCRINGKTLTPSGSSSGKVYVPTGVYAKKYIYIEYIFGELNFPRIDEVSITNLSVPVAGRTPDLSATPDADSEHYGNWKITFLSWHEGKNTDSSMLDESDTFKGGRYYTVQIFVQANPGYLFTTQNGLPTAEISVNGEKGEYIDAETNGIGFGFTKTYYIPKTVTAVNITSVTEPVAGNKPNYEYGYDTTKGYTVDSIKWYCETPYKEMSIQNQDRFEAGKTYSVLFEIRPKDGYHLQEIDGIADFTITVNGKAADFASDGSRLYALISFTYGPLPDVHTCTPDTKYESDKDYHWKNCTGCGLITGTKEAHKDTDSDGKCDKCAYETAHPPVIHTCTPSAWKSNSTQHWKECTDSSCKKITSAKENHYDKNSDEKCDVCQYAMPIPLPSELILKKSCGYTVNHKEKTVTITVNDTASSAAQAIENKYFSVLTADKKPAENTMVMRTGMLIQVLSKDSAVLSEYKVIVKYDCDGNGIIQAADARLALRTSVGLDTLDGVYKTAADSDSDGIIKAADARAILRKSVGLD